MTNLVRSSVSSLAVSNSSVRYFSDSANTVIDCSVFNAHCSSNNWSCPPANNNILSKALAAAMLSVIVSYQVYCIQRNDQLDGGGEVMLTRVIIAPKIIVLKLNSSNFHVSLLTDDQAGDVFVECEFVNTSPRVVCVISIYNLFTEWVSGL